MKRASSFSKAPAQRALRVVVLVSGRGSNLRSLVAEQGPYRIHAVVSDNPSAPALSFAKEHGIRTAVVPRSNYESLASWDAALTEACDSVQPDLVVLAGFMRIVRHKFLHTFQHRILNVHPSLLPDFPGMNGPGDALAAGVSQTGCTVHLVDEGVDTGNILAQACVPVIAEDTPESLHKRIQEAEHKLLPRVVTQIATGELPLSELSTYTFESNMRIDA